MWNVLGQAATVAQLVGADVGGLISMIIQAAVTAQQNKKECEQLARRVFTVGELLQHLDPEAEDSQELLPKEKQGDLLVVYEFTENRSLDIHLHGQLSPVTASWKMRIEILLGVSPAIEYLQSYAERPVIHRDVKPSNILLDASWAPRLTDFGLALAWEGPDHEVSVCGTHGFAAPEYVATGTLNLTADVYSFGVVMLEVLTGEKAYSSLEEGDSRRRSLVGLAVPLIEAGDLRKMLDRRPAAKPTKRQLDAVGLVAKAAVRCVRLKWKARPPISEVVATLETALELARRDG